MSRLKHSVTLFGFGCGYMQGKASVEDILKKTKNLGADGFEIVAPQMVEGHPSPDEDWMKRFIDLYHKYDLKPVCYSIYVDNGKNKGRFLTEEERMIYTINEMEYAKRMGFGIVRSQDALLPETMERLLPYAKELNLHLAIELHCPYSPSTPIFQRYEELFERTGTSHLGVVMDFSSFTSGATQIVLNKYPDDVCHKGLLNKYRVRYMTTETPTEELIEQMRAEGADEADILIARTELFTGIEGADKSPTVFYRTRPDYEGFRRLLKHSAYMHAKYWYVDENMNCDDLNNRELLHIMKEEGYDGFVASEYEGSKYDPSIDEGEQIERHIRMLDQLWEQV